MAVRAVKNLQGTYSVFVNGRWSSTARLQGLVENTNPWDVEHIYGNVSESDETLIDEACEVAARDLSQWQEMGPQLRNNAVSFVVAALQENAAELVTVLTRELGKTAADAQEEIDETISLLTAETDGPHPVSGRCHAQGPQHASAVLIITPFSGAVVISLSQILGVLLAGNTVVWTPSPRAPESSQAVAQILVQGIQAAAVQAGQEFPSGTFSMLLGGAACSSAVMRHPQISAVEFTGSQQTATQVASELLALDKECHLHTSGPNQLYVHESADLDEAARRFLVAKTQSAGQRCTSVQDLLCDQAVHEALLKRVLELAEKVVTGASNSASLADADSDPKHFSLTPLVDKAALRRCQKLVSRAVASLPAGIITGAPAGRFLYAFHPPLQCFQGQCCL